MTANISPLADDMITVRVALDGPPDAGKATVLRSLPQLLGEAAVICDETDDERRLAFDWMIPMRGPHEGRAIRIELVSVPGRSLLRTRRENLIGWSDVVMCVLDSRRPGFDASLRSHRQLHQDLLQIGPRPVVFMANKRDAADAVPVDELRSALGCGEITAIVEGSATTGRGVHHAFALAVRAALHRANVRSSMSETDSFLSEVRSAVESEIAQASGSPKPDGRHGGVGRGRRLEGAKLVAQPSGGGPVIVDPDMWRIVFDIANGITTLSLDPSRGGKSPAQRLLDAGLIAGEISEPPAPAQSPGRGSRDVTKPAVRDGRPDDGEALDRRRAIRELRRDIRGY